MNHHENPQEAQGQGPAAPTPRPKSERTIVLVGLMGVGKTTIGRRLAQSLRLPFSDADAEIEQAAGCSISDFFELYGEPAFRAGERRVIARLLDGPRHVLATGGGAFMDADTRALSKLRAVTIWLKADLDLLMKRVLRKQTRPLLKNDDPRGTMERLIAERYPVYGEADITVETSDQPHDRVVRAILDALERHGVDIDP